MTITALEIRKLLKDQPELNILLEYQLQNEKPLIDIAIELAISDFNSVPPISNYSLNTFPSKAILFHGVAYYLANGEAERQLRNQINYNAQGLNANIDDKYQQYQQLAQHYYQLFMQRAAQLKQFLNMDAAWGQVSSPYSGINEFQFGS